MSIVLPIQLLTALEVNVAAQSLKATLALKATFLKKYFRVFAHLPVVAELGYTSQHSMGSMDRDTDYAVSKYGSGMLPSRVACDSAPSAELDFVNNGGSLVDFLDNGDLALAPSSNQQDPPLCKCKYKCNGSLSQ